MNKRVGLIHFLLISLSIMFLSANAYAEKRKLPVVYVKSVSLPDKINRSMQHYLDKDLFKSEVESAIIDSKKLTVANHNKEIRKAVLDEQAFSQSDLSEGNAAKDGQLLAANLIMFPSIKIFNVNSNSKAVPNIDNKFKVSHYGRLIADVKIVDTTTGQIVAKYDVETGFSTKPKIVNKVGGGPSRAYIHSHLIKKAALKISDKLIDSVFPMVILSVKGDRMWINRGKGNGLKVGDKLNIYHPGEELIDPQTGSYCN